MPTSRLVPNPLHDRRLDVSPVDPTIRAFHRSFTAYAPTPLVALPQVARLLGVRSVVVKDESSRLGASSFKILGASWATYRRLCALLAVDHNAPIGLKGLAALLAPRRPIELVAATDGNHGLALARIARLLGLDAHILAPSNIPQIRVSALKSEGAAVTVLDGNYDTAVATAAALADDRHIVISDTSWPGYLDVATWVADGYSTLFAELDNQLPAPPSLVTVQIGVGALASAAVAHYHGRSRILGVEPTTAACAQESVRAGRVVTLAELQNSTMSGLNCGTVSATAWPALSSGIAHFAAIDDDTATRTMRLMDAGGVRTAETGAAGLGGVIAFADQLDLHHDDTVLAIATEDASARVGSE